jgi:hypothetical protein
MGSAAPSLRRWLLALAVPACVTVGALVVAVALTPLNAPFGLGGGASGSGDGAGSDGSDLALATSEADTASPDDDGVVVATVALGSGWAVPHIAHDPSLPHDHEPVGSATTGASVALGSDVHAVVVRAGSAGRLALRFGTGDQPSPLANLDDPGWMELAAVADEGPDGLAGEEGHEVREPAIGPLLVPAEADRLDLVALDGVPETVEVALLPRFGASVGDGPASPVAVEGGPAIIPREAWADAPWADANDGCSAEPSVADHLQAIVVHHTVTANDYRADQVGDLLRSILYSHTQVNGWCDVGYNFVVDHFGRIWETRTGSIESAVIGGHARGFNTGTVGVAVLGQHHQGGRPAAMPVPAAASDAVAELARWKLGGAAVDPMGTTWLRNRSSGGRQRLAAETWHLVPTVLGHRDLGLTSCPGSHGVDVVASLPARLAGELTAGDPSNAADWAAHQHGPGFAVADLAGEVRPAGAHDHWSAPDAAPVTDAVVAIGGTGNGGYRLTAGGTLRPYGAALARPPVPVSGLAVDVVVRSDLAGGWVLDTSGAIRGFGSVGDLDPVSPSGDGLVALSLTDGGRGYALDRSGRLQAVGGAVDRSRRAVTGDAVDLTLRTADAADTGWVLDETGRLTGFGGVADDRVGRADTPVAVLAGNPDQGGWVVDDTGQFHPFGGARYVFPVLTKADARGVVDAARVTQVADADFLATDDARFVVGLHRLFLAPDPSPDVIDLQVTALEQGSRRYDLALPLARSQAWTGAELDRMYQDVLGRPPDAAGRDYWLEQIAAGLALADIGTYFYGSDEYARSSGAPDAYVARLYRTLLGREPDDDGLRYWTEILTSGQGRPSDVASGFYASIESRRSRSARLHLQVLGTVPSPAERDELADRLGAVGDVVLAAELAADRAFYRRILEGVDR